MPLRALFPALIIVSKKTGFMLWLGRLGCFGDMWGCLALPFGRTVSGLPQHPLYFHCLIIVLLSFYFVLQLFEQVSASPIRQCGLVIFVSWFNVGNVLHGRPSLTCPPTTGTKSIQADLSSRWPNNRQIKHMLNKSAKYRTGIKDFFLRIRYLIFQKRISTMRYNFITSRMAII